MVERNRTHRDSAGDGCVHQLFEVQALRTPDAVAVEYAGQSLTYGETNARASRLAAHLRSLDVGTDVVVGLCLERCLEMVVALLAILKAGGAYLPLDPTLPKRRLAEMLSEARCGLVVTRNSLVPLVTEKYDGCESTRLVLTLEDLVSTVIREQEQDPVPLTSPGHLAYVMYTSGSTGVPKGVEMPHRALTNLVAWQCSTSGMATGARTLQFASLGFDVSFQEIFSTLITGGTLVLIDDETRKDPRALLAVITGSKIDRLFLPVVMLERLAEVAVDQSIVAARLETGVRGGRATPYHSGSAAPVRPNALMPALEPLRAHRNPRCDESRNRRACFGLAGTPLDRSTTARLSNPVA